MVQLKHSIACLSIHEISSLSRDELADIIMDVAPLCGRTELVQHLRYYDRPTLERLVHVARRVCVSLEVVPPRESDSDAVQATAQRMFDYFG